jgi:hypothetical protein
MKSQRDPERRPVPSAAKDPRRRPPGVIASQHRPVRRSAALATYGDLGARGLAPTEAGNLTAYVHGLRPVDHGWTVAEIDRLLFLRYLVDRGRFAAPNASRAIHGVPTSRITGNGGPAMKTRFGAERRIDAQAALVSGAPSPRVRTRSRSVTG